MVMNLLHFLAAAPTPRSFTLAVQNTKTQYASWLIPGAVSEFGDTSNKAALPKGLKSDR